MEHRRESRQDVLLEMLGSLLVDVDCLDVREGSTHLGCLQRPVMRPCTAKDIAAYPAFDIESFVILVEDWPYWYRIRNPLNEPTFFIQSDNTIGPDV